MVRSFLMQPIQLEGDRKFCNVVGKKGHGLFPFPVIRLNHEIRECKVRG